MLDGAQRREFLGDLLGLHDLADGGVERSTRAFGVPAGATMPSQALRLKPGKPCSAIVGVSANSGSRVP